MKTRKIKDNPEWKKKRIKYKNEAGMIESRQMILQEQRVAAVTIILAQIQSMQDEKLAMLLRNILMLNNELYGEVEYDLL